MSEVIYNEKEFLETPDKELTRVFDKSKKIVVVRNNKDEFHLELVKGSVFGIKFTELIAFRHYVYIPPDHVDPKKEPKYSLKVNKPLSPLITASAIRKLKYALTNTSKGKNIYYKDLTEEEIDFIVQEMNKPIGKAVDVTHLFRRN